MKNNMPEIIQENGKYRAIYREMESPLFDFILDAMKFSARMKMFYGEIQNAEDSLIDQKGFSILEAMIGMALISISSLAFGQLTVNMALTQNFNDFRLSTNALASSLLGSIGNGSSCTQALQGVSFDPRLTSSPVVFSMPNKVIGAGQVIQGYSLSIQSLNFTNFKAVQNNPDGSVVYFGDLSLTTLSSRRVLGPNTYTILVDSIYLTSLGGKLNGCSSSPPAPVPTPSPTPEPIPVWTPVNDPCR